MIPVSHAHGREGVEKDPAPMRSELFLLLPPWNKCAFKIPYEDRSPASSGNG